MRRIFTFLFLTFFALLLSACGDRSNTSTERGRQAIIDDANIFLSTGECESALTTINNLVGTEFETEEVTLIQASAYACFAGFELLTVLSNIAGQSSPFNGLAKSIPNEIGDAKVAYLYLAVDTLTNNDDVTEAVYRSGEINGFMVFLQLGIIGALLNGYGNATSEGVQQTDLLYETADAEPAGEMNNVDACALSAAFAIARDSFTFSALNSDADTTKAISQIDEVCSAASGISSCSDITKNRRSCNGINNDSIIASAIVTSLNSTW